MRLNPVPWAWLLILVVCCGVPSDEPLELGQLEQAYSRPSLFGWGQYPGGPALEARLQCTSSQALCYVPRTKAVAWRHYGMQGLGYTYNWWRVRWIRVTQRIKWDLDQRAPGHGWTFPEWGGVNGGEYVSIFGAETGTHVLNPYSAVTPFWETAVPGTQTKKIGLCRIDVDLPGLSTQVSWGADAPADPVGNAPPASGAGNDFYRIRYVESVLTRSLLHCMGLGNQGSPPNEVYSNCPPARSATWPSSFPCAFETGADGVMGLHVTNVPYGPPFWYSEYARADELQRLHDYQP